MTDPFRTISLPAELYLVKEGTFAFINRQTSSDFLLSGGMRVGGGKQQVWACELDMDVMERAEWQHWDAFIAALEGQAVLFNLPARPAKHLPLGKGAGFAPGNDAITITGTTITGTRILEGATTALIERKAARYARAVHMQFPVALAGETVLKRGDVFGLGGNLYQVQSPVRPDASGVARVPFRWRLWKGAKEGDIVTFKSPTCRMQLADRDGGRSKLSYPSHGRAGLPAVEVPYV